MDSYVNGFRVWKMIQVLDWWRRRRRSRTRILRLQRENRDRLLDFAARRCPFYVERLKGRDPSRLTLEDFPPVDKTMVMENFEGLLTDPTITRDEAVEFVSDPSRVGSLFKGRYVASHTSGSSGLRGVFLIDKWGWEMSQALGLSGNGLPPLSFAGWLRALQAPFRSGIEIEVDTDTGAIRVLQIASAFDVGKVLNAEQVREQVIGGVIQGLGSAVSEKFIFDDGKMLNASFVDYKLPTSKDLPLKMEQLFVETPHPQGPYGARGVGEIGLVPTAPAVAGALEAFDGVHRTSLPMKDSPAARAILKPLK